MLGLTGNSKKRRSGVIRQNITSKGVRRDLRPVSLDSSMAYEILNLEYKGEDILRSIRGADQFSAVQSVLEYQDMVALEDTAYYAYRGATNVYIKKTVGGVDTTMATYAVNRRVRFAKYSDFVFFVTGLGHEKVSVIYNEGMFLKLASVANYQVNYTVESVGGGKAIVKYVDPDENVLVIEPPFEGTFVNGESVSQPAIPATTTTTVGTEQYVYTFTDPSVPSADYVEVMTAEGDSRLITYNTNLKGYGSSMRSWVDKGFGIPFTDFSYGTDNPDEGGATVSTDLGAVQCVEFYNSHNFQFNKNGIVVWKLNYENFDVVGKSQVVSTAHEERKTDEFYDCVATKNGVIYVAKSGIYALSIGGTVEHVDLAKTIKVLWEELTFDESSVAYFNDKLYITCKKDSLTDNDYILVYDFKYQRWTSMGGTYKKLYSDGSYLYGMDHDNNAVYRLFEDVTYSNFLVTFKEEDLGEPNYSKSIRDIHLEGVIQNTKSVTMTVDVWNDDNTKTSNYVSKSLNGYSSDVSTFDYQINSKPVRKFQTSLSNSDDSYCEFHTFEMVIEALDKIYKYNV